MNQDQEVKLEKQIQDLIKKYNLEKKLTVQKIKQIIYQAKGLRDIIEIIKLFGPKVKDLKELNKITSVFMEAWNNFPQKDLGGVSPTEKAEQIQSKKDKLPNISSFSSPGFLEKMSPFSVKSYPRRIRFIKIGKNEWGFEFPKQYF